MKLNEKKAQQLQLFETPPSTLETPPVIDPTREDVRETLEKLIRIARSDVERAYLIKALQYLETCPRPCGYCFAVEKKERTKRLQKENPRAYAEFAKYGAED